MNYDAIYERLIERARARELVGYCERHHVIPKCVGGSNEPLNIVKLTPEEHYVAHQLLVKIRPKNRSILWAASNMTGRTRRMRGRSNKLYGWLKRRLAEVGGNAFRGKKHSLESRLKMSKTRTGLKRKPHSDETKSKMSAASKGRPKSEAHRRSMSLQRSGRKMPPRPPEWNLRISEGNKRAAKTRDYSYRRTPEYRAHQAERTRAAWAEGRRTRA